MSIVEVKVVECDNCHAIQKAESATYFTVQGSITLVGPRKGRNSEKVAIAAPIGGPNKTFCIKCMYAQLGQAEEELTGYRTREDE